MWIDRFHIDNILLYNSLAVVLLKSLIRTYSPSSHLWSLPRPTLLTDSYTWPSDIYLNLSWYFYSEYIPYPWLLVKLNYFEQLIYTNNSLKEWVNKQGCLLIVKLE